MQQDNARPHISTEDPEFFNKIKVTEFNIHLV